jgi:ribosomal protein S18 acetylase RimI-like enzyme
MIIIRGYNINDREQVRKICYDNSSDNKTYRDNPELLLTLYCDYYIDKEPQNCFVATSVDKVIGYIICSENFNKYLNNYKPFMKKLIKLSFVSFIDKIFANKKEKKISNKYPAHMHIDIASDYQRIGLGSRLLDALITNLKIKGVSGLHLECGADNTKAINFYKKYGFQKIGDKGMVFGIDLTDRMNKNE